MKILIATDAYKQNTGGVTASVLSLCAGLRRLGHEVKILSPASCHKSLRDGDDYYIKSVPAFYYPDMRLAVTVGEPMLKELEAWHPDIIHAQTEGSARVLAQKLMKRCNAPLIMTCHTDYAYFVFGRFRALPPVKAVMGGLGKIVYRSADKVIAPSQKAGNFAALKSVRERIVVIPNGMELEKYQKDLSETEKSLLRKSLGIDDGAKVIVTVSRISKEKNIREIIEFFPSLLKKLPDAKLLIVGDGPDKIHLEKQAQKLNLSDSIIFTGRVPAEDVWRYYNIGDVFVSASTFEVHSMSYLEAMAQGLPLLCRADDALSGVLEHNINGMIYHSREEFTEFAYRMLSDDGVRKEMGQKALEKAVCFSSDAFAASVLQLYKDTIEEKREKDKSSARGGRYTK